MIDQTTPSSGTKISGSSAPGSTTASICDTSSGLYVCYQGNALMAGVGSQPEQLKRWDINKPLIDLVGETIKVNSEVLDGLKTHLQREYDIDITKVRVNSVFIEEPAAKVGVSVSQSDVSAQATAQLAAIGISLSTSVGELTAKFRAGVGLGRKLSKRGKTNKPGASMASVNVGAWEVSLTEGAKFNVDNSSAKNVFDKLELPHDFEPLIASSTESEFLTSIAYTDIDIEIVAFDELVERIAQKFSADGQIQRLAQKYRSSDSSQRHEAFLNFEENAAAYFRDEKRLNEFAAEIQKGTVIANHLALAIGSKGLARTAQSISALNEGWQGAGNLYKAFDAITVSGFSVDRLKALISGGNLIIGAIAVFGGLFGSGDTNAKFFKKIMKMLQDMQQHFDHRFDKIEWSQVGIQQGLSQIDKNSWVRFWQLYENQFLVRNQILADSNYHAKEIKKQIDGHHQETMNFLGYLVDAPVRTTMLEIGTGPEESITANRARIQATLYDALFNGARLAPRTGRDQVDTQAIRSQLDAILEKTDASQSLDLPLGFYLNLARRLAPEDFTAFAGKELINPHAWPEMLPYYLYMMQLGATDVIALERSQQMQHFSHLNNLIETSQQPQQFLFDLAGSAQFWQALTKKYGQSVKAFAQRITDSSNNLPAYKELPSDTPFTFETFKNVLVERRDRLAVRGVTLLDAPHQPGRISEKAKHLGVFSLSTEQFKILKQLVGQNELLTSILRNPDFSRARRAGHVDIKLYYFPVDYGGAECYHDYSVHFCFVLELKGVDNPLLYVTLFRERRPGINCDRDDEFGAPDTFWRNDAGRFYDRDMWKTRIVSVASAAEMTNYAIQLGAISNTLENKVTSSNADRLRRAEQDAKDINREQLPKLEGAYLELVAAVKLIDPSYQPLPASEYFAPIRNALTAAERSGDIASLQPTLSRMQIGSWQRVLSDYAGGIGLSLDVLQEHFQRIVYLHPARLSLQKAEFLLGQTERVLESESQRAIAGSPANQMEDASKTPPNCNSLMLKACSDDQLALMHQKAFDKAGSAPTQAAAAGFMRQATRIEEELARRQSESGQQPLETFDKSTSSSGRKLLWLPDNLDVPMVGQPYSTNVADLTLAVANIYTVDTTTIYPSVASQDETTTPDVLTSDIGGNTMAFFEASITKAQTLFDADAWDPQHISHPTTGEPIFTYRVFKDGTEVGSADFYKHPLLCRSEDGTRHNLLQLNGVLDSIDIDTASIEDICAALPPTLYEQLAHTAGQGAAHGMIRGVATTVKQWLLFKGISETVATTAKHTTYYGGYFGLRCMAYFSQLDDEANPVLERLTTAAYQATVDTASMFATRTVLDGVSRVSRWVGNQVTQNGFLKTGRFFSEASDSVGYMAYVSDAYTRGAAHATISLASGVITEKAVKTTGLAIVRRL